MSLVKWTPADITVSEPRVNTYGGKMIYLDLKGTRKSPIRQYERARIVFDVKGTDYEGNATTQRNMNLEMTPGDLADIVAIENVIVDLAVANSEKWFGKKKMSRAVIEDRFESIVKKDKKGQYPPTVRFKVYSNPEFADRDTVVREIVKGQDGEGETYVLATADAITRNSQTVVKATFGNVWVSGNTFGLKVKISDMILWPCKTAAEEESPFAGFHLSRSKTTKRARSPEDETLGGDFVKRAKTEGGVGAAASNGHNDANGNDDDA